MTNEVPRPPQAALSRAGRYLLYTLSIPERALRSSVGLAAGAAREATSLLVPRAFQDSKTYEIVVRNSLELLIGGVAGIKSASTATTAASSDDYVARKAVGNFIDLASLGTLHLSPVWLLAIVSDLAYGTKTYVKELGTELARAGVIDENSTINSVEDVLEAVQQGSGRAANLFDTPPLSVVELRRTVDETRSALSEVHVAKLLPAGEIRRFWDEMKKTAHTEDASLLAVSGTMTLHMLDRIGAVTEGAICGLRVAGGLLDRVVIGHYSEALKRIVEKGLFATLRDSYGPYVSGVFKNFAAETDTVTTQIFDGRLPARFGRWVGKLFRRRPPPEQPPCSDDDAAP